MSALQRLAIVAPVILGLFLLYLFLSPTKQDLSQQEEGGQVSSSTGRNTIVYSNATNNDIQITSPLPGDIVDQDFVVTGKARGPWFFEASFPVSVFDESGNLISRTVAQADGEWMTTDFVLFAGALHIPLSYKGKLRIVAEKDNPSDMREKDASVSFWVNKNTQTTTSKIALFLYDESKDSGEGGALCTENGLTKVEREVAKSMTPAQDAIRLLLKGELLPEEKSRGLVTEFPVDGFSFKEANLKEGTLTLLFDDPNHSSGGGSCRVAIRKMQIEKTAMQFEGVQKVILKPETLFQP